MFANARLQSLVCSTDLERAASFYSEVLGLALTGRQHGALVFDVGGQTLRVAPVPTLDASSHTVLGFGVESIEAAVRQLATRNVMLARFPQMPHDERGVVRLRDGTQVAWFRDPDGNLLSVVEYPREI